jgi:hypothetical protein
MRHLMAQMGGQMTGLEGNNSALMTELLFLQAENDRLAGEIEAMKVANQNLTQQIDHITSGKK